jgi:curli biogenesis system outer membrane secretion channel CsgG
MSNAFAGRSVAKLLVATVVFFNLVLSGCTTVKVQESMRKPAQINMAGYEQITVGKVEATMASDRVAMEPVRQRLITGIQNSGMYRVYDRDSLEEGLREAELAQYLGGSDSTAGSNFTQANALVTGVIERLNFGTNVEQKEEYVAENQYRTVYRRVGTAEISVSLKVIDLESFEIVAAAPIRDSDSQATDWSYGTPPQISPEPSYDRLYDKVAAQFMKKIAPYTEPCEVILFTVGESLLKKNALRNFKAKEYSAAEDCFRQIIVLYEANPKTSPKTMAKALHNLATAQEFQGNLEEAMTNCDAALAKHTSAQTLALKARLKVRVADRAAFADQGIE